MTANVIVTVERQFDHPRAEVFRAWTDPAELARWRGSPGWHVDPDTVSGEARLGGRHRHVKVPDDDPASPVTTDGVYTEFFEPDVFVSSERITGDPGIDPDVALELRVEFTRMGREGTLVRIIQGPYEPEVAGWHGEGWEKELGRLAEYLRSADRAQAAR
ncbi:SRPBCC domain-containing protein [Kineococcus sp. R8]|uniref:SRPBCC family protein n=1 Tax=Kineococcus siccus TaxID=2696567 RepID=UPI0014136365|nr:SRPBCC domain-containing protein [Kineococcus siccus]NAZ81911.1 SRPBCC domain-containing protein [Kineococcus siccus]